MSINTLLASVKWYPVLFDSALNAMRSIAFWLTVAIAIAFALCVILLHGDNRKKFLKPAIIAIIAYAAAVGVALLALTLSEDGIVVLLFVPLLILILAVAASAVTLFLKRNKLVYIITGSVTGAALIATLICMGVYSADSVTMNDQIALYICAILFMGAVIAVSAVVDRKNKFVFDSKSIAYAAICIAMSFALSYLRIVRMPQGGSITPASLLPLMLYAFMFGVKKGIFAGFIYGLLQALQSPDGVIHPAQFVLDFPLAFACMGLAGLFANLKALNKLPQVQFLLGGIIAGLGRFIMHFISGTFAFGAYAPEGQPAWLYSLGYQAGYVLPDVAIAVVAGALALCSPAIVRLIKSKTAAKPQAVETAVPEKEENAEV